MKSSTQRAFTLIELLVVIAIIAILAAILFPVFAQAKKAAKATADLSNLKQMGTSHALYNNDNDGVYTRAWYGGLWATFPASYPQDPPRQNQYKWMDAMQPYIKNADLFTSPTNVWGDDGKYIPNTRLTGPTERRWGTYAVNASYWNNNDEFRGPMSEGDVANSDTAVDDVAGTFLIVDGGYRAFQIAWENVGSQPTKVVGEGDLQYIRLNNINYTDGCCQYEGSMFFRHSGKANATYTDGHAKSIDGGAALKRATRGPTQNGQFPLARFTAAQDD